MYLTSNIPYFKCWVRKEFTNGHQGYHGEYLHGLAVAVTTIPDRCLGFQIIFSGYRDWETDRKSTRLNSSHSAKSRMPSSA